MLTFCSQ